MPLPSNNKQVGDLGHADDHNSIVNEINALAAASANYLLISASSNFLLGSSSSTFLLKTDASNIYLSQNSASTIYAFKNSPIFTGSVTASQFIGKIEYSNILNPPTGGTASVSWINVTDKPDPIIGLNISGIVTGAASVTLTDLSNGQININTQSNININTQTVSSYTLQLSDSNKLIMMNSSSTNAIVIPINSSVSFPIGSQIDIIQIGSGTSSITFVNGVTLNSDSNKKIINSQYSAASVFKVDTNSWILIGAIK